MFCLFTDLTQRTATVDRGGGNRSNVKFGGSPTVLSIMRRLLTQSDIVNPKNMNETAEVRDSLSHSCTPSFVLLFQISFIVLLG